MSKPIRKLNDFRNPESFIQVNTIKGFKYVDKAGEIVNYFHLDNNIPQFTMNLNGLTIERPKEKIDHIRITPQIIWMKFSEIDSLDMISQIYAKETAKILQILEVTKLNRVGWRNYFIHEFKDEKENRNYFKNMLNIHKCDLQSAKFSTKTENGYNITLIIQRMVKTGETENPAVLFDIDVFTSDEIESSNIQNSLNEIRHFLSDELEFLEIANSTFLGK